MVKVKFTTNGANSAFGGFVAGDELRCSEAMAKHLVDDVKCAKYADIQKSEPEDKPKPVKRTKAKE